MVRLNLTTLYNKVLYFLKSLIKTVTVVEVMLEIEQKNQKIKTVKKNI